MRNLFRLLSLFVFCVMLSSCAGSASKYYLVRQHEPRESTLGFSITPPPGDNWYETLKNNSLCYLKISRATAHSYSIYTQATEVTLTQDVGDAEAFLEYVRAEKETLANSLDRENVRQQYSLHRELENCVQYEQLYEDYSLEGLADNTHVDVNVSGLYCMHPENKGVAIDISYLEKSVSGRQTPSFRNEGEKFISSLSFNTTERL